MEKVDYSNLKQFAGLYLEDSFVDRIVETEKLVSFKIEFSLTKDHPQYYHPSIGEAHCYQRGEINFIAPRKVTWEIRNNRAISIDANEESDLGNIDILYKIGNDYLLEGDWGKVLISCDNVEVEIQKRN